MSDTLQAARDQLARLETLRDLQTVNAAAAGYDAQAIRDGLGNRLADVALAGGDPEAETEKASAELAGLISKAEASAAMIEALGERITAAHAAILQAKADALEARAAELEKAQAEREATLARLCAELAEAEGPDSFWLTGTGRTPEARRHLDRLRGAILQMRQGHPSPVDPATGRGFDADL